MNRLSIRVKIIIKYAIIFSLFFAALLQYYSTSNGNEFNLKYLLKNGPQKFLTAGDFSQLIDLENFEYRIQSENCENFVRPPTILILVHSAPNNFEKRQKIRETWGLNDTRTLLRFSLGTVDSTSLQTKIKNESETYKDIVQGNFHDAYRNMTYKHVMVFKWFIYECPKAQYLLKTDDDVGINIPLLLNDINDGKVAKNRLILCARNDNPWVARGNSKWAVTYEEYAEDIFPRFCQGYAILYSKDVIKPLYDETQRLPYFWIDDAQITGIVRLKVNITLTAKNHEKYFAAKWDTKVIQKKDKQKVDGDLSRLIDLQDFKYLIKSDSCENFVTPPSILILVHSAPENFEKRQKIRDTWGKNDTRTQLRFMLGAVDSFTLQDQIYNESVTHQDLVQGNFHDHYRNMTYKHTMVLKWFLYECPKAQYLLKTDDDAFVNITTLVDKLSDREYIRDKFKLIYCATKSNEVVIRGNSKWTVTKEEYADDVYPEYCAGYAVLYSNDVVKPLYEETQKLPYFWIDDVHITGTARVKVGAPITDNWLIDNKKLFWGHS